MPVSHCDMLSTILSCFGSHSMCGCSAACESGCHLSLCRGAEPSIIFMFKMIKRYLSDFHVFLVEIMFNESQNSLLPACSCLEKPSLRA